MFQKKTPLQKEWEKYRKKENKYLEKQKNKKDSFINQKLEEKVPEKLQETLNVAFAKAFRLIFEKGTGVIEKTYRKEEIEKQYQINEFTNELKQNCAIAAEHQKHVNSVNFFIRRKLCRFVAQIL